MRSAVRTKRHEAWKQWAESDFHLICAEAPARSLRSSARLCLSAGTITSLVRGGPPRSLFSNFSHTAAFCYWHTRAASEVPTAESNHPYRICLRSRQLIRSSKGDGRKGQTRFGSHEEQMLKGYPVVIFNSHPHQGFTGQEAVSLVSRDSWDAPGRGGQ